jgi:hypothetical protein
VTRNLAEQFDSMLRNIIPFDAPIGDERRVGEFVLAHRDAFKEALYLRQAHKARHDRDVARECVKDGD